MIIKLCHGVLEAAKGREEGMDAGKSSGGEGKGKG